MGVRAGRVASLPMADETVAKRLIAVLGESLALDPQVIAGLTRDTLLFGNLPELDSMAVATVLTAIEDAFHIIIDDDDVSGAMFETVGALADFVGGKLDRS